MTTFIRAIEVWRLSDDGLLLEFGGGLFGTATRFAAISRDMCFGRGEGLPGRAWDEGRPILLKRFDGSNFRRTAAAQAAGLSCGLALPIFVSGALTAVLVFFYGDAQAHAGAVELWHHDPRVAGDLALVDGYDGSDGGSLETPSGDARLPKGKGLARLAWQRGSSVLIDDIAASPHSPRADAPTAAGIDRGLAIPCTAQADEAWVAVFLSASATPVAPRIERWLPQAGGAELRRADGFGEGEGPLAGTPPVVRGDAGGGSIGRAFSGGVPVMAKSMVGEPEAIASVAAAAGLGSMAAIPVVAGNVVVEVVTLYF